MGQKATQSIKGFFDKIQTTFKQSNSSGTQNAILKSNSQPGSSPTRAEHYSHLPDDDFHEFLTDEDAAAKRGGQSSSLYPKP